MGISFSCPFANDSDIEFGLQSIIVRSVSLGDNEMKTPERSISFKYDSQFKSESNPIDTMIMKKSFDSGKMILEGSVSFKQREMDTLISISTELQDEELVPQSPKHEAALKLQKVYKSFRTRRKLADCAVLVEQRWWKLLDFAELKHSSVSFFDIEHHETAISRWSRAKTRAAKVGKGLSKNGKAQKLARQHWLEAIDPRHRYGHNLHFYFDKWLHSQSREPFFYWLDIGEGKELNLEQCLRCKLQEQCIKYLGPMERKNYEVAFEDGKFFYKESGEVLDTSADPHSKWIFVLSTSKTLYVGKKKKGTFQHSSFLAGGATSAAGRLVVENGTLKAVWPHSGHYRPTPENFQDFISFLTENNVDLTDVKMDPAEDEEPSLGKQESSLHMRNNSEGEVEEIVQNIAENQKLENTSNDPSNFNLKLSHLKIPSKDDLLADLQSENPSHVKDNDSYDSETHEEIIPTETILKRINSHKEAKSYQLGKQLSFKWTTGAGPRIVCVRDYPSELQSRALEQVNLSPRSADRVSEIRSPKTSTPKRSILVSYRSVVTGQYKLQSSPLCLGRKNTV